MDIEGEKYIIENWKTDAGQMMIQKVYPANHEPKSVRTGVIGNGDFATPMSSKLDELKRSLYQSIQDERYEDAAKYRDLIKNFK
jgi:protein-arginine kinase activator protein McsA